MDETESSGNVWRTADTWPIPSTPTHYYLTPARGLQTKMPFKGIVSYHYDPKNLIPTLGGRNLFLESGPKDQQSVENREDVVLFTGEPLAEDTEVTGNVSVKLFFSSDQNDTDVVVKLCDVYPDGRSILITEGAYRLGGYVSPKRNNFAARHQTPPRNYYRYGLDKHRFCSGSFHPSIYRQLELPSTGKKCKYRDRRILW